MGGSGPNKKLCYERSKQGVVKDHTPANVRFGFSFTRQFLPFESFQGIREPHQPTLNVIRVSSCVSWIVL